MSRTIWECIIGKEDDEMIDENEENEHVVGSISDVKRSIFDAIDAYEADEADLMSRINETDDKIRDLNSLKLKLLADQRAVQTKIASLELSLNNLKTGSNKKH